VAVAAPAVAVAVAPARPPRALDFVRLKLRLTRNGFRGQPWKVVAFVMGLLFGVWMAFLAFAGLAASGAASPEIGYVIATFAGTAVVLGWTLVPLLFFGVDETLDPARFALLPVPRMTLSRGMIAAAFVGIPALATLVGTSGLVVAAAIRFSALEAVAAFVGVVVGLLLGVVASRAVTSAFANMLRSRRVRDLAAVIIAVLASGIGPLQWGIMATVGHGSVGQAVRVADVLAWTPLGAPYQLPFDVAHGQWIRAVAHLVIAGGAIALLVWWWTRTIESAMIGTTSNGTAKQFRGTKGGAVESLVPPALRRMFRPSVFAAIVARESRFWWRDPRRRASLVSILMASAILPIALSFAGRHGNGQVGAAVGFSLIGFSFAVTMAGTMGGMLLGNQFGFDGNAYAAHVLAQVPGRVELRARALAMAMVAIPVQVAVVVAVTLMTSSPSRLPTGLGILAAAFGAAIASASLLSVLAPYALPENSNPFAMNSGAGSAKGMLALVAMIGTLAICTPVSVAAYLLTSLAFGPWVTLAFGIAYGVGAAVLGTYIGGSLIDRRGPEILVAVTPRR
jgi:ABC-2 type transport system permease protein